LALGKAIGDIVYGIGFEVVQNDFSARRKKKRNRVTYGDKRIKYMLHNSSVTIPKDQLCPFCVERTAGAALPNCNVNSLDYTK
jgi:hypothetical protein